jgi:hypothetical protein
VDGVILILEPGETSEEQAKTIKEQLDRAGAKVLGIVFNKVSEVSANSYYDYQYRSLYSPKYYGDYISKASREPATASRSKKVIAFLEHGQVPSEVETEVQSAIMAIKTQPKKIVTRIRKSRKNGKD